MKTPTEWATIIIKFLQNNPVTTLEAAENQIKMVVEMVQKDMVTALPANDLGIIENVEGNA